MTDEQEQQALMEEQEIERELEILARIVADIAVDRFNKLQHENIEKPHEGPHEDINT